MRLHPGALLAVAASTFALSGPVRADPSVIVTGRADACPAPAAVAAALAAVAPGERVEVGAPEQAASARIDDLGPRYRVQVGQAARTIEDPGRDCKERARVAAIVVALTLFPPSAGGARGGSAARPPTPAAPRRAARAVDAEMPAGLVAAGAGAGRRSRWHAEIELTPLVSLAAGRGDWAATAAGALRIRAGAGRLGLSLGAEAGGDVDRRLTRGAATLGRYGFDLGAYAASPLRRIGVVGELGLALAALHAAGRDIGAAATSTGLELGIRAGVAARVWLTRSLGVSATAAVVVVPQTLDLVAPPAGSLGTTPRVWIGLGLGVIARRD
jgi:hypothetical protein